MTPKIFHMKQRFMVGVSAQFQLAMAQKPTAQIIIPNLWNEFQKYFDSIPHKGATCMGLVIDEGNYPEMRYIAAQEVRQMSDLPPGLVSYLVPAGNYAIFTHKGKLSNLHESMSFIYGSWLQENHASLRSAPHIEIYDERYQGESDASEFDIGVPVV